MILYTKDSLRFALGSILGLSLLYFGAATLGVFGETSVTIVSNEPRVNSHNNSTISTNVISQMTANSINAGIRLGSTGESVRYLQMLLNSGEDNPVALTGAGSRGLETTYFGQRTRAALIVFQRNHGLQPTGIVDGPTEILIDSLIEEVLNRESSTSTQVVSGTQSINVETGSFANTAPTSADAPRIISISPAEVYDGNNIVISGANFESVNTVNTTFDVFQNVPLVNGTLSIPFHSVLQQKIDDEIRKAGSGKDQERARNAMRTYMTQNSVNIPLMITVSNSKGSSNMYKIVMKIK